MVSQTNAKTQKTEQVVALVRRVYRAGTAPKLGILIPERDEKNREVRKNFIYLDNFLFAFAKSGVRWHLLPSWKLARKRVLQRSC